MITTNNFTPVVPDPWGVALTISAFIVVGLGGGPAMLWLMLWMSKKGKPWFIPWFIWSPWDTIRKAYKGENV